ncbi:transcriptional regulator [Longispora fulva]|uniref:Putative DNA-binding transcriptional regulator YafY n=1 Tax=Longispora fulva TaxID=619741 RepID=A0A8J7GUT2_9ACTN|nr:WYL domain-containing protein [Longispora fulva]MBG6137791.1 putative DNA-binding transcriptional regulator YafY [Longispora fulva]GIG62051.1 transcriptional regulator [Longispora fulva]
MRASRLLSLILLLQTRGRMTAQALADELEVSVRTIYRDVDALHSAGIPLYGDAGHAGGYQLLDGYRTRLTGLTADEADSLFLAGMPGPAAELGLGAVVAATQLKLMASLPEELRDRAGRIRARFHLDAPNWYAGADDVPHLAALARAVWEQRRVDVRYRRWRAPQEVTRTLEPYGLVLKGGRWYLVAASDGLARTYRVSQVLELHVGEDRFDREPDFDLAGHWARSLAEFAARRFTGEAVLRLSPVAVRRLEDLVTDEVARAVADTAATDPDGWIRATVPIESVAHAHTQLLVLGAGVEVLSPPELRAALAETAREVVALYAG